MNKNQFKDLLLRYSKGLANDQERKLVETWYTLQATEIECEHIALDKISVKKSLMKKIKKNNKPIYIQFWKQIAAALIISSSISYIIYQYNAGPKSLNDIAQILPNDEDIIIELADGQVLTVPSHLNDTLITKDNLLIITDHDGNISYKPITGDSNLYSKNNSIVYNTISTPRGKTSKLTLIDGSQVILNASSSITFPISFSEKIREVEISGEAYFHVTHTNDHKPFIVKTSRNQIEVLGTKFIVQNYSDNPINKTTLLDGKVEVSTITGKNKVILNPGEEANITGNNLEIGRANESNSAWLNNDFIFIDQDLKSITQEIERWYDVNFIIEEGLSNKRFSGAISKNKSLQEILKIMDISQKLKFEIINKTIYIKKY